MSNTLSAPKKSRSARRRTNRAAKKGAEQGDDTSPEQGDDDATTLLYTCPDGTIVYAYTASLNGCTPEIFVPTASVPTVRPAASIPVAAIQYQYSSYIDNKTGAERFMRYSLTRNGGESWEEIDAAGTVVLVEEEIDEIDAAWLRRTCEPRT